MQELDNKLTRLLGEKKKLENDLLKLPEHPRNLNDIRLKKEINIKITKAEHEINEVRTKIRNYEF